MKSYNRRYIPEIDEIRALAALLVVFYHGFLLIGARLAHGAPVDAAKDWVYSNNPLVTLVQEGHSGVGLFIVLSGFILSVGALDNVVDYRRFLWARILRIYPVFLLLLVAASAASHATIGQFFSSLLPLPVEGGVQTPLTSMFWAVAVEFQCYLVFPFLIAFSNARGTRYLAAAVCLLVLLRLTAVFGTNANPRDLAYWTVLGRGDQFIIGIMLARLARMDLVSERTRRLLFPLAVGLALFGLWLFNRLGGWIDVSPRKTFWPDVEGLMWAFFIWTYIPFSGWLRSPAKSLLLRFGIISYPAYLIHYGLINVVLNKGLFFPLTGNGYLDAVIETALIVLPLTIVLGALLHVVVEKPFLEMRPKYIERRGGAERQAGTAPPTAPADRLISK